MNKALIAVDVQPDFEPGGPLGVPDGHEVIPALIEMMDDVDIIVLTRDWHPQDHISFSTEPEYVDGSWPVHCVAGTKGAEIDMRLMQAALATGKPVLLIHKGMEKDVEQYSGFNGIVADIWNEPSQYDRDDFLWNDHYDRAVSLWEALINLDVHEVRIGGLALDYCVKFTALDAADTFDTSVHLNATQPVSFLTGAKTIKELVEHNIKLEY